MGSRSDDDITPHLNLREYWHKTFEEIFQAFSPDEWKLEPTTNGMPEEWRNFKDGAKVKFLCSCGNSWTSMRGIVIFWFKKIGARQAEREERGSELGLEATTTVNRTGNVYSLRFKLYGQQCKKCDDEDFQNPRWYKEEVDKVLKNVHQKIGEAFYDFHPAETDSRMRSGRPRRSHDSARCQACREGHCRSNSGR